METPAAARKIAANALEAFLDGYVIVPDGSPLAHDPIVLDMMRNRLEAVRRRLGYSEVVLKAFDELSRDLLKKLYGD